MSSDLTILTAVRRPTHAEFVVVSETNIPAVVQWLTGRGYRAQATSLGTFEYVDIELSEFDGTVPPGDIILIEEPGSSLQILSPSEFRDQFTEVSRWRG